jgi:hypothetical protein
MILESMIEALMMLCVVIIVVLFPVGLVLFMLSQFGLVGASIMAFLLIFGLLTFSVYLNKK